MRFSVPMRTVLLAGLAVSCAMTGGVSGGGSAAGTGFVEVAPTPEGGLQPQAAVDARATVAAANATGDTLFAWTEGTRWQKGGTLAWQRFDPEGGAIAGGRTNAIPAWGFPAVVARSDGTFTIFH